MLIRKIKRMYRRLLLKNLKLVHLALLLSTLCLFVLLTGVKFESQLQTDQIFNRHDPVLANMRIFNSSSYVMSNCSCSKRPLIAIVPDWKSSRLFNVYELIDNNDYAQVDLDSIRMRLLYQLTEDEYANVQLMCNIYSSLRRGKHQKVISYSLFGKKAAYYHKLTNLTRQVRELFPGWIMRIYYDDTIDSSIICDLECETDENGELLDIFDFCHAHAIDRNLQEKHFNADYIREIFFPIFENILINLIID